MLSDWKGQVEAFTTGLLSGGLYFAGLWLTLRVLPSRRRPALWALGSLIFRAGALLLGLYLVASGDWARIVLWLLGFLAARALLVRGLQSWKSSMKGG
jgi:F1F0 ATPase subunit 2